MIWLGHDADMQPNSMFEPENHCNRMCIGTYVTTRMSQAELAANDSLSYALLMGCRQIIYGLGE